jgi:hypothetical protein
VRVSPEAHDADLLPEMLDELYRQPGKGFEIRRPVLLLQLFLEHREERRLGAGVEPGLVLLAPCVDLADEALQGLGQVLPALPELLEDGLKALAQLLVQDPGPR